MTHSKLRQLVRDLASQGLLTLELDSAIREVLCAPAEEYRAVLVSLYERIRAIRDDSEMEEFLLAHLFAAHYMLHWLRSQGIQITGKEFSPRTEKRTTHGASETTTTPCSR